MKPTMRGAEDLAEAKMRILESERALVRLDAGSTLNTDEEFLRDRFTRQLREALEDYFFILSGDQRKAAAKDI